ncbi:MAG: 16S rRNA (cytosine(1402)-N(4))-methyltransferase RsmH [Bacteroidales bacterium]|jgi:16S rRNA (cytosine1402-N4)-methyltransferase|nr:16S rRNA (cytosine(1402)-N(4))-methyltransferase RsmH [Bacteroidales bacterium]
MQTPVFHVPALLAETINGLNIKPEGVYVDCTFGGGGHAKEIILRLNKKGKLLAFDQDEVALQNAFEDKRLIPVHSNFKYLKNFLNYYGFEKVDGILADLGVSFHHFDEAERGFSFRFDGCLDMRMNRKSRLKAADILNTYTEEQLADVFYFYGELRNARAIAQAVVNERNNEPFDKISPFVNLMQTLFPKGKEKKELTKVFQALRIEVNQEMEALKALLKQSVDLLNEDGRLVILTYHSLEDRLVKNFIRTGNFEGKPEKDFYGNVSAPLKAVNNRVIVPDKEEIASNPRARSAKLRIATLNN